jgi:threonine dehydratase
MSDEEASLGPGLYQPAGSMPPRVGQGYPPEAPDPGVLAAARAMLRERGVQSPARRERALSVALDRDVWVKYESFLPVGSFKLRGALWAVGQARSGGAKAVVTASTGNHGQGMALAGLQMGVPVTVFIPAGVDALKQRRMGDLGAELRTAGAVLTEAEAAAQRFADEIGGTYVEDGESADLLAGAASIGAEILDQVPAVDTVIAPVGGGNLAAALCLAMSAATAPVRLIGVQSTAAPAVTLSWLNREAVRRPCRTLAGGLATEHPGGLALAVLCARLDAMGLVDEDDLWSALRWTYDLLGHNLELAAAAPFAALRRFGSSIPGETVVVVASGACISAGQLAAALSGQSRQDWIGASAAG